MIGRAFPFLQGCWNKLTLSGILMLIGGAASMAVPVVIGSLFDPGAGPMPLILLLLLLCSTVCSSTKNNLLTQISNRVATRLRIMLMTKILALPKSYFDVHSSAELLSRIGNDVNRFRDALSGGVIYILEIVLSLTVAIAIMVTIQPLLTVILLGSSALILIVNTLLTRKTAASAGQAQQKLAQINSLASQGIVGIQTLWAYNLQHPALHLFRNANQDWEQSEGQIVKTRTRVNITTGVLGALQLVLLIGLGTRMVHRNSLTTGQLLSFILYAQGIAGPMASASSLMVDVRAALGSMARVFEILDEEETRSGKLIPAAPMHGAISVQDVSFSYSDGSGLPNPVLTHLNLEIPAGKTTALVGSSGSGKTTLMNIIAGFLQADSGQVCFDGTPISALSPDYLRSNISIVSQNPYLFEMSVYNNIAAGDLRASREQVLQAARLAGAHDFILALPQGYDTVLGENGMTLSGGQRQRISIARAFLRNAPILLLDEATSALDNRTERIIQQAIETLAVHKTVFVIAHRLSTIRTADKICYLSDGAILDEGPHQQLLRCDAYRQLYDEQKQLNAD